jgi:hypothetical protein
MSKSRRPLFIILAILLALGAIEGIAWWWMNPAPAGIGEPVLAYRPPVGLDRRPVRQSLGDDGAGPLVANGVESEGRDQESEVRDQRSEVSGQEEASASSSPNQKSTIKNQDSKISSSSSSSPTDHRSLLTDHFSTTTPLPEVYRQAAPMLRCSSGQVFHVKIQDTIGLHGAFFEWDGTDTGSVLEAFRHMPEACMGSIGMKLVSKEAPIPYTLSNHTLIFDHTVFRDHGHGGGPLVAGPLVHAFRAVWVSGVSSADARQGLDGRKFNQLRAIRLQAALTRFRPAHARVIQGAVRGLHTPEAAWQAFEQHMLRNLTFER